MVIDRLMRCGCGYQSKKDPRLQQHARPGSCFSHLMGYVPALERLVRKREKECDLAIAQADKMKEQLSAEKRITAILAIALCISTAGMICFALMV